ncbi:MAG: gfo/Idh/MocA family oxidoreductase [Actinobacteria bacterium]|nr:gfo/Idh/MocA family oxidoreductase [Actinomycetota bacterium]
MSAAISTSRLPSDPTVTIPEARPAAPAPLGPSCRTLRAGVVGLGHQAREDHLPAIVASEMVDLVAVCDLNTQILDDVRDEYDKPGYTELEEMLATEQLDFIVVAVPHHAGRRVVKAAAQRGVHVLKEKPFATSLEEAHDLTGSCADGGIELMVTLQRRLNPIYATFPHLYDQIGRPFLIDGVYTMSVDPASGWRGQSRLAGGGCIIDMGYHMIDMLLWYFGLPDRVLAQSSAAARPELDYDAEDTACVMFSFDSGLWGRLLLSRCVSPRTETIRVIGARGSVVLERGRIQRLLSNGQVVESLSREGSWPSAATAQVDHFCRVLMGQRPNTSGPESHLAHAAFIHACYASAQAGRFVNPKELIA